MSKFGFDDNVKIDRAHVELIYGLVVSAKPTTVLEFGLGGGTSANAILNGLEYNHQPYEYDLVDNWGDRDFAGVCPAAVIKQYGSRVNIITSDEGAYAVSCNKSYDFIMSDGDHMNADQWHEKVYEQMLNPGGILIYHDVGGEFPALASIYRRVVQQNIRHVMFDKNSLGGERCHRGLLVIFKD